MVVIHEIDFIPLNHSLTFSAIQELDYILLQSNEGYDFFGYGDTLSDAVDMLKECIRMVKQDYKIGLINSNNTDPDKLRHLTNLFG